MMIKKHTIVLSLMNFCYTHNRHRDIQSVIKTEVINKSFTNSKRTPTGILNPQNDKGAFR